MGNVAWLGPPWCGDMGKGTAQTRVFDENFVSRKFRETGYKTIFVFRENEGRVSQFRETADITKETSFVKHENRENKENLK
jgi:hypothetical protein